MEVTMKFARTVLLLLALAAPTPFVRLLAEEQRSKAPGADASAKLDLNHASRAALEAVPVIGPQGAQAIIAARPFKSLDELDRVKGIPAETLEQIRAKVYVAAAPATQELGEPTMKKKPLGAPSVADPKNPRAVDINSASRETLAAIPVIGPDLAEAIIAARPFKSLDELNKLKGLTTERLEQVRAAVTVTPPRQRRSVP
jgi:competence protein ComEA